MILSDEIILDVRTCELTISQVRALITKEKAARPGYEIFLDGDAHALVARRCSA